MSPRFRDIDSAFKWGVPLHIWDGTGHYPTDEQKAEMVAYVQSRNRMESWETYLQQPKDGGIHLE